MKMGVLRGSRKEAASFSAAEPWRQFASGYWERSPVVIQRPRAVPICTSAEAFQASVTASDAFRAGDDDVRIYFYIDHAQVVADVEKHLPKRSDRTAANYARRIGRQLKGRRFALIVQEVQAHHAPLWLRLRNFQREFEEGSGISGHGAKATLFLGDYAATPFGVHRGNSHVFKFVVAGRKRIHLWPDRWVRARGVAQHTLADERLGAASLSLEGGPGELLYWPPEFWHVGKCIDGLTISVSLALFPAAKSITRDLARCAESRIAQWLASPEEKSDTDSAPQRPPGSGAISRQLARAVTALQEAVEQPDVEEAVKVLWLNRASSFGYSAVPPPLPHEALSDNTWVKVQGTVLWMPGRRNEILCSANGHAFGVTAHPRIIKLLGRLNEGKRSRVKSLLQEYAGSALIGKVRLEATPGEIRAVLEKLRSFRAIVADSKNDRRSC